MVPFKHVYALGKYCRYKLLMKHYQSNNVRKGLLLQQIGVTLCHAYSVIFFSRASSCLWTPTFTYALRRVHVGYEMERCIISISVMLSTGPMTIVMPCEEELPERHSRQSRITLTATTSVFTQTSGVPQSWAICIVMIFWCHKQFTCRLLMFVYL